jgi:predicted nucleic acid-binding protein
MRLIIHDANILIDLLDLGLLDRALSLPYLMETTDLVRCEVQASYQERALTACIEDGKLSVIASTAQQILAIHSLYVEHSRLSLADCSVIFHALDRRGIILSGDRRLRNEAATMRIEVHGTPWILDQMVKHGILDPKDAIEKLELLMCINKRLPHKECVKKIDVWRKKQ